MPDAARGARVLIEGITARYPGTASAAVEDVSLDIPAGELTVLLGPSGCGKSTLLRTINRLVPLERGTISLDGVPTANVDPNVLRRGIGYVIQASGLFPHMTVAENIGIVPGLIGWERPRIAARVDELLTLVELDPERYRGRLPRMLSGGEQQRVGVARALAANPPLLLMDEPFGAVDALVRTALQDEVLRIHRALGTTIVFVTHDVDEALRIADRLVVMSSGKVVQADTPLRMLSSPASPYVEALLDANDLLRRLGLITAADAMRAPVAEPADVALDERSTLRSALGALLAGAQSVDIVRDGVRAGTLTFADIRRALTPRSA